MSSVEMFISACARRDLKKTVKDGRGRRPRLKKALRPPHRECGRFYCRVIATVAATRSVPSLLPGSAIHSQTLRPFPF